MRIGNSILTQVIQVLLLLTLLSGTGCGLDGSDTFRPLEENAPFNADRAYQDVLYQLSLGPRIPGTKGHQGVIDYITEELEEAGWQVEEQTVIIEGKTIRNLIASREQAGDYILLGAHYDTRILADQDPQADLRGEPVPGANDGASGVAVLLELARILPESLPQQVRLVFFDAEDNGRIGDWEWILGSRAYVSEVEQLPSAAVIVDMIGDADLQVYYERNSDPALRKLIWDIAADLGYGETFIPLERHSMLDDHTPFLEAGIPAVDIIDFDYPYWHTTQDTGDKVSPESLGMVGKTLATWLSGNYRDQ